MIKAIETRYDGYRFRSRLEAKWAVFFNAVGIDYCYEEYGFDLDGIWYLPDFKLRLRGRYIWVEVKGQVPTEEEERKALRLCIADKHPVCILVESPGLGTYIGFVYVPINISEPEVIRELKKDIGFLKEEGARLRWTARTQAIVIQGKGKHAIPRLMFDLQRGFKCITTLFAQCPKCKEVFLTAYFHPGTGLNCECPGEVDADTPFLRSAYVSARSARFEHGEVC